MLIKPLNKTLLMGDSSYGRNFDQGKKNEIQYHT
jgi:hypothetical protein